MFRVYDEFTKLQKVIVGDLDVNTTLLCDKDVRSFVYDVFQQTKEDLNALQKIYERHKIEVYRPNINNLKNSKNTKTEDYPVINPLAVRDNFIVLGDTLLETASFKHMSHFEYLYYKDIFTNQWQSNKHNKWLKMPSPMLSSDSVTDDDILEYEPILDAAQILRFGDTLIVSSTGAVNQLGIDWLKQHFAQYKFVILDDTIKGHIDGQIKIVRPGLLMTPHPVDKLPSIFKNWEVIDLKSEHFLKSHQDGLRNAVDNIGSQFRDDDIENTWVCCSTISIDENTIILYEHYKEYYPELCKALEKHKIDIEFMPYRHQHWFGQGISCITLELQRQGSMQKYT